MEKQKPLEINPVTPSQQFVVVGASGAMGQLIIRKAVSLGHKILHGIVGPDDEMDHVHSGPGGPGVIPLKKINEFDWQKLRIYYSNDKLKPIIIDATHDSVVHYNWGKYYKVLGFPVIFITTGITKEDIGDTKSHVLIASPNACPELVSILYEFKNIPSSGYAISKKSGSIRYGITESHQGPDPVKKLWGKKNPSSTAKFVDECLAKAGYEKVYFESIRDQNKQVAMGVSPRYLDGHAYHTYRFMFENVTQIDHIYSIFATFMGEISDYGDYQVESFYGIITAKKKDLSIIFELKHDDCNLWFSHFVNGRQPYVDGLFSNHHGLGNFVARISQRKPEAYDMFDLA